MSSSGQIEPCHCPLCGEPNLCQLSSTGSYEGPCWCAGIDIPEGLLARIPVELRNRACICQACVTAFWGEVNSLSRPGDFYFDQNGLMVFTAAYHLRRGYCCGNNCRHCPYRTQP